MTTQDDRKMAEDALALAESAMRGPWDDNGQLEIVFGSLPLFYHFEAEFYEPEDNMTAEKVTANLAFVVYARDLVPDLATRLLAALDRNEIAASFLMAKKAFEDESLRLSIDKDKLRDELFKTDVDIYQIDSIVNWKVKFSPEIETAYKKALADFEKTFGIG